MPNSDHEFLRRMAVRWLSGSQHCSVVLSEIVSYAAEIPDAIGWQSGVSTLVECKSSKSDFCANFNKPLCLMGSFRYFLSTPDVIPEEYFDRKIGEADGSHHDWGLLWPKYPLASYPRVQVIRKAIHRVTDHSQENLILLSALRRVQTRSFLTVVSPSEEEY